jgi:hypothetical protein
MVEGKPFGHTRMTEGRHCTNQAENPSAKKPMNAKPYWIPKPKRRLPNGDDSSQTVALLTPHKAKSNGSIAKPPSPC